MSSDHLEIEVKIKCDANPLTAAKDAEVAVTLPRHFEDNWVLDFSDCRLRASGSLLRLRTVGDTSILTWKGPARAHPALKIRREIEVQVRDGPKMLQILGVVGLSPVFRYQKYRTSYRLTLKEGIALVATFDETPIGSYLELEGEEIAIGRAMESLGIPIERATKLSYTDLYRVHCQTNRIPSGHMTFDAAGTTPTGKDS